jgi:glycosyltransferase involved in cell wall biosynthesis
VLALLTWNTCVASMESLCALVREAYALERLGHEPYLCAVDNGSDDGTAAGLRALEPDVGVPHRIVCNEHNVGNSRARNQIVDYALEVDADYILFVDGDIELVPHSSVAMLRYLEGFGRTLACVGADSNDYSDERANTTSSLFSLHGLRVETLDLVAWTQYGLFRTEIFRDGIRFDEDPPFDGAGWGFEDNDLAFQMEVKGYRTQRFMGVTYLHRKARSSIRIMRRLGIDADAIFNKRRNRLLEKWGGVAQIAQGPLVAVQRSTALPI